MSTQSSEPHVMHPSRVKEIDKARMDRLRRSLVAFLADVKLTIIDRNPETENWDETVAIRSVRSRTDIDDGVVRVLFRLAEPCTTDKGDVTEEVLWTLRFTEVRDLLDSLNAGNEPDDRLVYDEESVHLATVHFRRL